VNGLPGGDALGGGLAVHAGATVSTSELTYNRATGGQKGAGGHDGLGFGAGIYDVGVLDLDGVSVVKKNDASASGDDIFT
jgi:hypothetical protein